MIKYAVFISGQPAEHRLAQHSSQPAATVLAGARAGMLRTPTGFSNDGVNSWRNRRCALTPNTRRAP